MPAQAQTVPAQPSTADIANPHVQALLATLDLPQVIAVMHEEGIAYGEKLEDDLFPGAGARRISGRASGPGLPLSVTARRRLPCPGASCTRC